jgi:hypothetical protein
MVANLELFKRKKLLKNYFYNYLKERNQRCNIPDFSKILLIIKRKCGCFFILFLYINKE